MPWAEQSNRGAFRNRAGAASVCAQSGESRSVGATERRPQQPRRERTRSPNPAPELQFLAPRQQRFLPSGSMGRPAISAINLPLGFSSCGQAAAPLKQIATKLRLLGLHSPGSDDQMAVKGARGQEPGQVPFQSHPGRGQGWSLITGPRKGNSDGVPSSFQGRGTQGGGDTREHGALPAADGDKE